MLEVKNLSKSFKKNKAIDNISFKLNTGEISILCGPNGAGKTTTLKCILSLLRKDSGDILIDGKSTKDRTIRENLAYIPETPDLYNLLTVWEHFKFIALAYKIKDWTSKADELMNAFNLANKKDSLAKDLSKGMKQKVSIIMALIHDPSIILIDEPFVGLDPNGIKEFREILSKIKSLGKTILVSTHILASMEEISDTMILMKEGKIVDSGSKEYLKEKYNELGNIEDLFFKIIDNA
ncbi:MULTISPECIES: ABC transporter ATP-binding protein [Clostridium]|jgi:ABC-2 type transport system ATP-binding protein|uniref:ABC transporter ATP-binding protein n=2 Tax=Clostridiaceae TaxID=31979 RepID=UPI001AE84187|nr:MULTISPECIES: ABC transporter ATP-binding protein [Clostridium]MBP1869235.1 ABC-type multidrug transport system ATPase subunit [Clostridium tertium]MDU3406469.1 ABC transporter ATP-binding protein [Clostridium sp.]MDU3524020.1 ABC transporter ATP-binding protein [Clostridium sp.]MDU3547311.1 ABC transporter ATP-binding protein [Clostridium sp.]MDU7947697.1 ABC transporter ATP-binding protein [Clostridium sp.]